MERQYNVVNGTAYSMKTPKEVIDILDKYRGRETRIRVFYGDRETGIDWNEEFDTMGYIGRSTGTYKIPLLINKANGIGGGGLFDDCIVKITVDKTTIYEHPTYDCNSFEIVDIKDMDAKYKGYNYSVIKNDIVTMANFKEVNEARNYIDFMIGKRNKI